jgi:hypothetical protein
VIAIDALKRALLESDPEGFDARQDHWPQAFGTGIGLNCYAAWIKQDCKGWHDAHLNRGGSVTELSVTGQWVGGDGDTLEPRLSRRCPILLIFEKVNE